ncbi:adenosine 3'-phospho 5'-phosphosulfate transporter 2 isoform X1 [Silurus meridionalis]|nr:adenosine 3'-phospho 5'-phosphosulfate transporter 2 isoform X1 [Silurus meridionalis]
MSSKYSLINYNSRKHISISIPSSAESMSPHIKSIEELRVLGVNLSSFSTPTQFFICVTGVFVFYLIYGYLQKSPDPSNINSINFFSNLSYRSSSVGSDHTDQPSLPTCINEPRLPMTLLPELIFSVEGFKPFGWYLTLVQFGFYSMFGLVELQLTQDKRRRIPGKTYMIIAFLTVGTMGLSNTSLGYLNYPTQVIFKCCKLIPVMIGGIFIQGKRYNFADVIAALCMSLGLVWFTLADSKIAPNFNVTGVILISLALCADAAIGNVQEKAMKLHNGSNSEMVLYSYSIGFVYILLGLLCMGGLGPAVAFCAQHPVTTYGYAFFFSLTGYFGISFVLALIKLFGALVAVTVTTGRKAMTIVLSFLFFSKPFSFQYVWGGLLVIFGIFLNVYSKNKDKMKLPPLAELWKRMLSSRKGRLSQTV